MMKGLFGFTTVLAVMALLLSSASASGTVTKKLRPQVHTFDEHGQPTGPLNAAGTKGTAPSNPGQKSLPVSGAKQNK
jgi:hypothetical protein